MDKGSLIQEKKGAKRAGLVTDYEEYRASTGERTGRWCEIMWDTGEWECFDSFISDWDRWNEVEVIDGSR